MRSHQSERRLLRLVTAFLALYAQQEVDVCHGFSRDRIVDKNHRVTSYVATYPLPFSTLPIAQTVRVSLSRRYDDLYGNDPSQKSTDVSDDSEMTTQSEKASSQSILDSLTSYFNAMRHRRLPPPQVEDVDVLFYDIFLILNLSVSISFWVVHRMDVSYIGTAFNEGCLMCLLWIVSGLSTGAFLNSAVDGHFGSASERGGPKAAAALAFHTFLNAVNLRLLFALAVAVVQHRPVGIATGEQLMPLELAMGWSLMIFWRSLHSSIAPRM